jgi:hypothetical protein
MAYNPRNQLKRILDIQEITLREQAKGVSKQYIYENYIWPVYKISRGCYSEYLGINARRELKVLDEKEKREKEQKTLFPDV